MTFLTVLQFKIFWNVCALRIFRSDIASNLLPTLWEVSTTRDYGGLNHIIFCVCCLPKSHFQDFVVLGVISRRHCIRFFIIRDGFHNKVILNIFLFDEISEMRLTIAFWICLIIDGGWFEFLLTFKGSPLGFYTVAGFSMLNQN